MDIHPADLNGDGKIDFILAKKHASKTEFCPYISTGSSFIAEESFYVYVAGDNIKSYVADLNSDGKSEFIAIIDPGFNTKVKFKTYAFTSDPTFHAIPLPEEEDNGGSVGHFYALRDLDADSKPELIRMESRGTYVYKFLLEPNNTMSDPTFHSFPSSANRVWWGDFNADGYCDIFWEDKPTAKYSVNIFNGNEFVPTNAPLTVINGNEARKYNHTLFSVEDYNGDGISDISMIYKDTLKEYEKERIGFTAQLLLSNGSYFSAPNAYFIETDYEDEFDFEYNVSHIIGDYNGDGNNDLLFQTNHYPSEDQVMLFSVKMYSNNLSSIVNSITDEYDNTTVFITKYLTSSTTLYRKLNDAIYPFRDFKGPVPVVAEVIMNDGLGNLTSNNRIKRYYYEGAKLHLHGKGFLGFSKTSVTDLDAKLRSETQYSVYSDPFYISTFPIKTSSFVEVGGQEIKISETQNDFEIFNDSTEWGFRHAEYLKKSQIKEWALDGTIVRTQRTINIYDENGYNYGNPLIVRTLFDEKDIDFLSPNSFFKYSKEYETVYDYSYVNNWILIRPDTVKTIHKVLNQPDYIEKTCYKYFPINDARFPMAEKKIINIDDPMELVTTYDYNEFGQLITFTNSTPNFIIPSRQKRYLYDSIYGNRFLTGTINELGYSNTNIFDVDKGVVKQIINENNISTFYHYDSFKQLYKIVNADKTEDVIVKRWIDESHPDFKANAVWYSWKCKTGSKPILTLYDKFCRDIRLVTYNQHNQKIYVEKEYNHLGQLDTVSNPHFAEDSIYAKIITKYDELGRVKEIEKPGDQIHGNITTTYNYGARWTSTTDDLGRTSKSFYNAKGELIISQDPNLNHIDYSYYSDGFLKKSTINDDIKSSIIYEYDKNGNKTKIIHPVSDTTFNDYNPYKELIYTKDSENHEFTYSYDIAGRLLRKNNVTNYGDKTEYNYYSTPGKLGLLKSMSKFENGTLIHELKYDYGIYNRLIIESETIEDETFNATISYDKLGRIYTKTFSSGLIVEYAYKNNSIYKIFSIRNDIKKLLWESKETNEFGSITKSLIGDRLLEKDYITECNILKSTKSADVQYFEYVFDNAGNLEDRYDHIHKVNNTSLHEKFIYDNRDQLIEVIGNT